MRPVQFELEKGASYHAMQAFGRNQRLFETLILVPLVALFRAAKRGPSTDGSDVIAGALLATRMLGMLVPARLWQWPALWCWLYTGGHAITWIAVLVFLLALARQESLKEG